jgi:type IV protein arginine methyltransferase
MREDDFILQTFTCLCLCTQKLIVHGLCAATMAAVQAGQGDAAVSDRSIEDMIYAASEHDVEKLNNLIDTLSFDGCRAVDIQQPSTGYTPLHAAIISCIGSGSEAQSGTIIEQAENTVRLLLENGAIWNQLDRNDRTPGCIAYENSLVSLYNLMVDAGVRAEMLLNRLDEYDELNDGEAEEEAEEEDSVVASASQPDIVVSEVSDDPNSHGDTLKSINGTEPSDLPQTTNGEQDVSSAAYLSSALSMSDSKLLDEQQNGVMMSWEKNIMAQSANALLSTPGLRFLNIGFGMGIIDSLVQDHTNRPVEHHIIEAHPDVLKAIQEKGWQEKPGVVIHAGKWQDILPVMAQDGLVFDGIYYDTFAESYMEFKEFFSEHILGLLETTGKWSYFNGMGADRQISYDVYQRIVEMDLLEAGYDVEWTDVALPDLGKEWEGIRRKYWNVDRYRLPVCKFLD